MNVLYDGKEQVLIVKIRSSVQHNVVSIEFHNLFWVKLVTFGVQRMIGCFGSTRFGDPSERCKEADHAYKPIGRLGHEFPSMVLEVGVSESLGMLQADAAYWLRKSDGQVRIVIILHVHKTSRKMVLERWECVDIGRPRHLNVVYRPNPRRIQSLELVDGQQYVGSQQPSCLMLCQIIYVMANSDSLAMSCKCFLTFFGHSFREAGCNIH